MTLIELRKLAEAAPRFKEWYVLPAREPIDGTHSHSIGMEGYGVLGYWKGHKSAHTDADWLLKKEDADFIAAANPAAVISLLDRIQALQAENERLKEEAKQWQSLSELSLGMAEAHSKERDALAAKMASLEADAERLDFLEQNAASMVLGWNRKSKWSCRAAFTSYPYDCFPTARQAIDAAKGGQHD